MARFVSKECNECGVVKPADQFYKRGNGLRPYCIPCYHLRGRSRKYGVTVAVLRALPLECGVCGATRNLKTDHDHRTGVLRGMLCARCNLLVGVLEKNSKVLAPAVEYIRRHREVHVRT